MIPLALLLNSALANEPVEVLQSPTDSRAYEVMTLGNGLRVLLVSDPETDMAAAALNVRVGYYDDPADRPGLAHFLEHMLFLGTAKYPEPDAYRDFITRHGGRMNAYTSAENTVYFFDIERDYLEPALDRFTQFFVSPLFAEQFVQREMQAVEAEYRMRIRDDGRRLNDAIKETVNPAHPLSKFSTGNLSTLRDREGDSAREAVIDFYRRHYSANLMTATVIGAEPIERLREMVAESMAAIGNTGRKPPVIDVPVVTAQQAQRLDVVPYKDQRILRVEFAYPWDDAYLLTKPASFLAHLIGHEGRGSLHERLRDLGWITRLGAGGSRIASNEGVFSVSMDLTEAGVARVDDIVALLFRYIALARRDGIVEAFHDELTRINKLDFMYREKAAPRNEAVALAGNLQIYPPELVLFGPYSMGEFDEDAVRAVLARLHPGNMRLTVVAPGLETDRRSLWYDTPYRLRPLDGENIARWAAVEPDPILALPEPNIFLPRHARLKAVGSATERPAMLASREGLTIWHMQDGHFRVPKADLFVSVETAPAILSPRGAALTLIYLALAKDALNPWAYPAEVAGLRYNFYKTARGFGFSISGYDENKRILADIVVDRLLDLEIDADAFAVRRAELIRQWRNSRLSTPYVQLFNELDHLLHHHRWTPDDLLAATEDLTPRDLEEFVDELFSGVRLEVFAHGNLTAEETRSIGEDIAARIFARSRPGEEVPRAVALLAPGSQYLRSIDTSHDDTAVLVYYQAGDAGIGTAARVLMIEQLIKSPFFETLRTQEQLGYVVSAQSMSSLRLPGLTFLVQSPAQGPLPLSTRIDRFIASFRARIEAMDADAFSASRQGLIAALRERDSSLNRRSRRLQSDLALGDYSFDRSERLAEAVESLAKDDVLAFYDEYLLSGQRSRIILQASGNGHREQAISVDDGTLAITDISAFRSAAAGFRLPGELAGTSGVAMTLEDAPGDSLPRQ